MTLASWGFQLDLLGPPSDADVLDLDYGEDDDDLPNLLISEDSEEDEVFLTPARAALPSAPGPSSHTSLFLVRLGFSRRVQTSGCPLGHLLASSCSQDHLLSL